LDEKYDVDQASSVNRIKEFRDFGAAVVLKRVLVVRTAGYVLIVTPVVDRNE